MERAERPGDFPEAVRLFRRVVELEAGVDFQYLLHDGVRRDRGLAKPFLEVCARTVARAAEHITPPEVVDMLRHHPAPDVRARVVEVEGDEVLVVRLEEVWIVFIRRVRREDPLPCVGILGQEGELPRPRLRDGRLRVSEDFLGLPRRPGNRDRLVLAEAKSIRVDVPIERGSRDACVHGVRLIRVDAARAGFPGFVDVAVRERLLDRIAETRAVPVRAVVVDRGCEDPLRVPHGLAQRILQLGVIFGEVLRQPPIRKRDALPESVDH